MSESGYASLGIPSHETVSAAPPTTSSKELVNSAALAMPRSPRANAVINLGRDGRRWLMAVGGVIVVVAFGVLVLGGQLMAHASACRPWWAPFPLPLLWFCEVVALSIVPRFASLGRESVSINLVVAPPRCLHRWQLEVLDTLGMNRYLIAVLLSRDVESHERNKQRPYGLKEITANVRR